MDRWEEYKESQQTLRIEYETVGHHWRFIQGLRFIFLGIAATTQGGLLTLYRTAVNSGASSAFGVGNTAFDQLLVFLIPIFGMTLAAIGLALERLIERMLSATTRRGRAIEREWSQRGIFTGAGVGLVGLRWRLTVPFVMLCSFLAVFLTWVMLEVLSFFLYHR